jgi:hypothetical protein
VKQSHSFSLKLQSHDGPCLPLLKCGVRELLPYKTFLPHEEGSKTFIFAIVHQGIIVEIVNHEWRACSICPLKTV